MKAEGVIKREYPDPELMALVAKGDKVAFRELSDRYLKMIYAVAFRMFPEKADADDVVQDALVRLWNKAGAWDAKAGASVSTWIYRITYNIAIDHKRRQKAGHVPLPDHAESDAPDPEMALRRQEERQYVRAAVESLPERQRAALVLCHFEGLSNAQAAEIMDTTVKSVEGLLVRARKTLKDTLIAYKKA